MAEKPAVGDGDIAVVAHQIGLFRRVGALGGRTVEIGVRGRLERLALGDALIQGETPADLQRGHGTPDDREIVAQSEVLRHVGVDHAAELVERVVDELLRHGIRLQKLRNLPVLAVFAVIGIGLGESREGDRLALALHGIEAEIVRKDQLVGAVDEVDITARNPLFGALHDALLIAVIQPHAVEHSLAAAVDINAVRVVQHRAQGNRQPIGVHAAHHLGQPRIVERIQLILILADIASGQHLVAELLFGIHQVVVGEVGELEPQVGRIGDPQLPRLGLDRLDDDHTVGSLRTIDGRRSGIFEHRDAGDTVHAQVLNLGDLHLDAVEDEERLIGRIVVFGGEVAHQTGLAANLQIGQPVGVGTESAVLDERQGRFERFETLKDVLRADGPQLLARVGRRRTGEAVLVAAVNTRHHHFVDLRGVLFEHDFQIALVGILHLEGDHAYEGENDGLLARRNALQAEFALGVGRGADAGRRFHIDRGTDNEFAFLVFDIAGYRPAGFGSATLCMNEQGGGDQCRQQKQQKSQFHRFGVFPPAGKKRLRPIGIHLTFRTLRRQVIRHRRECAKV